MESVRSAIEKTIPISQFNRGLAGKIFEDVKRTGPKVVMKNNVAECVLMSPEEYIRLMDENNDTRLLELAMERMSHFDPSAAIPIEELEQKYGFHPTDSDDIDEVEFE